MNFYQKHIFICTNQKVSGKKCCAVFGEECFEYLRSKLLELDLFGPGKIRVSKSGCLGRCGSGPCVVIYPEGKWFRCETNAQVDLLITQYIINNQMVESLLIPD